MKQRTIYFFALLFLSMCISIKLQGQTFTYKKSASSKYIQYNSNDIKSTVGNNTYTTSMGVSVSNGVLPSIRISMTVIGDKSFIDLFRIHKIDTESSHITYANIILENGVTIYNCKSAIIDDTNRDRAKDYLAIGVIMIGTHDLSIIKKLRSYNIKEITIEGHTINFEKMKFKSAMVIDGACKEIEKEGYSFETAKVDKNVSSNSYGNNVDSNFAKKNSQPESSLTCPDAISPNGDGKNDFLFVTCKSIVKLEAVFFDRWGKKIASCNMAQAQNHEQSSGNKLCIWDGYIGGKPAKDGVYFINLVGEGSDGVVYKIKKAISVLKGYTSEGEMDGGSNS